MNDGGPAFPKTYDAECRGLQQQGMSLRDYFAACALQGLMASPALQAACELEMPSKSSAKVYHVNDRMACAAYMAADAMLRLREDNL